MLPQEMFKLAENFYKNLSEPPLLVWLHWLEHCPIHQNLRVRFTVRAHTKVASLIPSQGGNQCEAINQCFPLTPVLLSPSLPLLLKSINIFFLIFTRKKIYLSKERIYLEARSQHTEINASEDNSLKLFCAYETKERSSEGL